MSKRTVIKAAALVQVMPVWGRLETCMALSGLPENIIRELYNDGKIRARKTVPDKPNSACVFRLQDIFEWLEEEAAEPPQFRLPGDPK